MLTVRVDDDEIEARLRERAAANGHSPEDEAREMLRTALLTPIEAEGSKGVSPGRSLVDEIQELFAPFGGVELDIPPRGRSSRVLPTFD